VMFRPGAIVPLHGIRSKVRAYDLILGEGRGRSCPEPSRSWSLSPSGQGLAHNRFYRL